MSSDFGLLTEYMNDDEIEPCCGHGCGLQNAVVKCVLRPRKDHDSRAAAPRSDSVRMSIETVARDSDRTHVVERIRLHESVGNETKER